jgi:hypothetical protein
MKEIVLTPVQVYERIENDTGGNMAKNNIDAYKQGQIDALNQLMDEINLEIGGCIDDHRYRVAETLLDVLEMIKNQKNTL